ncbi:hypothetical protein [Leuconostoc suionicum]|uniref:hypothetical protein n=1 Tax=Leuconostoc suionicum TaxID=1511761 RepID=UPI00233EFEE3|nr:hypothetical protein [Leuconostoc suionicum]MDC2805196.1 hypothetical protein [Leuconostoc suionicum]MDC2822708.1 hypothetical protein [Leuconostoc suionicum]
MTDQTQIIIMVILIIGVTTYTKLHYKQSIRKTGVDVSTKSSKELRNLFIKQLLINLIFPIIWCLPI